MASKLPGLQVRYGQAARNVKDSHVQYIRCDACAHVWVTFADGSVHHVTPLNEKAS